jgi:hypothetical protein
MLLAPRSQGSAWCVRFSDYCDSIVFRNSGSLSYGQWDWACRNEWTYTSIIGNANRSVLTGGAPRPLAARPYDAFEQHLLAETYHFSFQSNQLLDVFYTDGIANGVVTVETGERYTIKHHVCSPGDLDIRKPRLTDRGRDAQNRLTPKTQSARCLHFTNFCDTVVFDASGTLQFGDWDWQCTGDWTQSSILGQTIPRPELATRPGPTYGFMFPYSVQFSFKPGNLFDLYETDGVGGVFAARQNEPYVITNGACTLKEIDTGKPRVLPTL